MKQKPIGLVLLLFTMLTLAACVRPAPQPDPTAVPEPDPDLVMTQPAALPEQPLPTPIEDSLPVATPISAEPTAELLPTEELVQDQIHIVVVGDTLFKIASQYGVTIDSILAANDIPNVDQLVVGQQILILAPGSVVPTSPAEEVAGETPAPPAEATSESPADGTHVVTGGENLYRIGLKYGCSVEQMAAANGIVNPAHISIGQVLQVPDCN